MNQNPETGPLRWERGARRVIAKTPVLDLCGVSYRHPVRGTEREFICMEPPDWVNVVAVTKSGQVVLVRQFRFGINEFSLEVPGGVMEPGEDPVEAGLRELAEETGFGGGEAVLLSAVHPNPAIQSNRCHFVLARNVEPLHALNWDENEELAHSLEPMNQVWEAVLGGGITHSLSVCALALAKARLEADI